MEDETSEEDEDVLDLTLDLALLGFDLDLVLSFLDLGLVLVLTTLTLLLEAMESPASSGRDLERPRAEILTRFILRFFDSWCLVGGAMVGGGLVVEVVLFMLGKTILSLMFLFSLITSPILPPQFLTQLSPVWKLLPLPPQPLYLNFLQSFSSLL